MYKLLTLIINKQLYEVVERCGILSNAQSAFRHNRSTTINVVTLRNLIEEALIEDKELHALFIDLEKAYDSLPHKAITSTLGYYGASPGLKKLIAKLYCRARAMVCMRYGATKSFTVNKGVKQGDPLSPLLWNLFINPIVEHLLTANTAHATKFGEQVGSTVFADDIMILASSKEKMTGAFNMFNDFCSYHQLRISVGKSTVASTKGEAPALVVQTGTGASTIPLTPPNGSVWYLGVEIRFDKRKTSENEIIKKFMERTNFIASRHISAEAKAAFVNVYAMPAALYDTPTRPLSKKGTDTIDRTTRKTLM